MVQDGGPPAQRHYWGLYLAMEKVRRQGGGEAPWGWEGRGDGTGVGGAVLRFTPAPRITLGW